MTLSEASGLRGLPWPLSIKSKSKVEIFSMERATCFVSSVKRSGGPLIFPLTNLTVSPTKITFLVESYREMLPGVCLQQFPFKPYPFVEAACPNSESLLDTDERTQHSINKSPGVPVTQTRVATRLITFRRAFQDFCLLFA